MFLTILADDRAGAAEGRLVASAEWLGLERDPVRATHLYSTARSAGRTLLLQKDVLASAGRVARTRGVSPDALYAAGAAE